MDYNVGDKVWKAVSKLGVIPKEKEKYNKKKIEEIELNNKKRMLVMKVSKNRGNDYSVSQH